MQFSTDLQTASYINKLTLLLETKQTVTSTWQNTWSTRARCWVLSSRKQLFNSWKKNFSLFIPSTYNSAHKRSSPGSRAWPGSKSAMLHRHKNQGSPLPAMQTLVGSKRHSQNTSTLPYSMHCIAAPTVAANRDRAACCVSPGRLILHRRALQGSLGSCHPSLSQLLTFSSTRSPWSSN